MPLILAWASAREVKHLTKWARLVLRPGNGGQNFAIIRAPLPHNA
ncbi:hypothetical protein GLA29479_843 [Lysobacter antibioticus]|nr:hypothetical protein GLA29479_843 [Lysobacter antibioticus]